MKVEGSCHCGRITYEAIADPNRVTVCHCTDCQTLSGSAFRASLPVPIETFVLHSGQPKTYVKIAESGARRAHTFCPDCGSPIHSSSVDNPRMYSLRVGCLWQRAELPPRKQIWCRSSLDWAMDLRDLPQQSRQ